MRANMIPDDVELWDGMWMFRMEGRETCREHDWQPWTGNSATRKRVCKNCKREEIAEWVL